MDVDEFATVFADGAIKARLDWSVVRERCTVRESFSRSAEVLGSLFTVWYIGPDGGYRAYLDPDARPLRVRDHRDARSSWPAHRARKIDDLVTQFKAADQPVQLVLPAYALPGNEMVLLDGNHRAVAAYLTDVPVRTMVFALHGPVDEAVLPDLRHHLSP